MWYYGLFGMHVWKILYREIKTSPPSHWLEPTKLYQKEVKRNGSENETEQSYDKHIIKLAQ